MDGRQRLGDSAYDAGALDGLPNHTWHTRVIENNRISNASIVRLEVTNQSSSCHPHLDLLRHDERRSVKTVGPDEAKSIQHPGTFLANMLIAILLGALLPALFAQPGAEENDRRAGSGSDQLHPERPPPRSGQFRIRPPPAKQRGFILTATPPRRQIPHPTDRRARVIYEIPAKRTCSV